MPRRRWPSRLLDFIFLIRPALLWASTAFFFAGVISGLDCSTVVQPSRAILEMMPNLVLFLLITASAFVINQVFDVRSDALNRKAFIIPRGLVAKHEALAVGALLSGLALIISLKRASLERYLGWTGIALGIAYSLPPIRLKARAVGDLIANVAGFGVIGFVLGKLSQGSSGGFAMLAAIPYGLAMAAIFLNTCIADEEGDRAVGDRTTCVVFGRRAVSKLALIMLASSGLMAAVGGEVLLWLGAIGSMPGFVALAFEPTRRTSIVANRIAAGLLVILISIRIPLYGFLAICIYLVSRWYYRRRFGLDYPSLSGPDSYGESKYV